MSISHFTAPRLAPRNLLVGLPRFASPSLHAEKTESLQTQREYLNILRLRHLQWMNSTDDAETGRLHHEIANLIEQIADRYQGLLDAPEPAPTG